MVIVKGKLLNSKTEWHQPKIVRTAIHSDGAELAGGRIVSFPVDGSQRTQENRHLPPPPPRRGGQGSASQPVRTSPSPRHGGQGSASQQPVREAPRRSTRKRNGQQCRFKQFNFYFRFVKQNMFLSHPIVLLSCLTRALAETSHNKIHYYPNFPRKFRQIKTDFRINF